MTRGTARWGIALCIAAIAAAGAGHFAARAMMTASAWALQEPPRTR